MEIEKVSDDYNTEQPQPKKQIRRRLHTSKPYQERLLNMAEARREIATALKFHRASMKQQKPPANQHHLQSPPPPATNYWHMSTIVPPPPPLNQEHLNLVLPDQTLGLNLNFQDFSNINTTVYHKPMSVYSSSSSSSSLLAAKEVAVVDSARWCKSLETIETRAEEDRKDLDSHEDDDGYYHPFEQVMEFPSWLINSNETTCFQQLFDHHFSDEYSPDPALPCMDIGEIEGMDGEWLA